MRKIKYFLQFIIIFFLFFIFKLIGQKFSTNLSGQILSFIGPLFRSKVILKNNISLVFPKMDEKSKKEIIKKMWINYGKILAEYIYIKKFRIDKIQENFEIEGQEVLENIKENKKPVVFISGHFNNFELMAMHLEKSGINLTAVYRPLNNFFLNRFMEKIRKKYICEKQIKKGISGTKNLLRNFKNGSSIALMIDQRVSEGIKSKFFGKDALTTTIPAQFFLKFKCEIVPVYIERKKNDKFKLTIYNPISFSKDDDEKSITLYLNQILEKMILKNPDQWIWSHNRWK